MALGYSAEIDGKSPWLGSSQPWGDPTTVILLNEHYIQLPSKFVSLYPGISSQTASKSFLVQWVVVNIITHGWSESREKVSVESAGIHVSHLDHICITAPFPKAEELLRKRG